MPVKYFNIVRISDFPIGNFILTYNRKYFIVGTGNAFGSFADALWFHSVINLKRNEKFSNLAKFRKSHSHLCLKTLGVAEFLGIEISELIPFATALTIKKQFTFDKPMHLYIKLTNENVYFTLMIDEHDLARFMANQSKII